MPTTLAQPPTTFGFRHSLHPKTTVTSFSVDVVDGSGLGVAGEPVTASFTTMFGDTEEVRRTTDGDGRARFVDEHSAPLSHVEVMAAGETTGHIRPAPGSRLVIET